MMTSWWSRGGGSDAADEEELARRRRALVDEVQADMAETARFTGRAALQPRVAEAMGRVPRHEFVPEAEREAAYANRPLPIGWGQTISQPFIVALMTDFLDPAPDDVVLELGTGSGYQAAVLSLLVRQVYSIELVPELADGAARTLARLGYRNIEVRAGDGADGWPDHAPFDKIIVTAEADEVPQALIDQLKPGGRLLMPVGDPGGQQLTLVEKRADGTCERREVLPVAFVPLRSGRRR